MAAVAGAVILLSQVDVMDDPTGATRACGSAFDGVVDRSGWESWWVSDLDDPDATVRASLLRTTQCPAAINSRIVVSGTLGALSLLSLAMASRQRRARAGGRPRPGPREELRRLGTRTTVAGSVLTAGGLLALIMLVADGDSTLFLYTDRLVVAVVGLLVLIPPIALLVIGRSLSVVSTFAAGDETATGHAPVEAP